MGKRRQARELVIQFLYQVDVIGTDYWAELLEDFWNIQNISEDVKEYSNKLIKMVLEKKPQIDQLIARYATNWDLNRIAVVDRNVLRASVCELLYMEDIPPIVSINEAIDIAKKYGTVDSGKFVNGILDKVREELVKETKDG